MIKRIEDYNKNLILNYIFKLTSIVLGFVSTRLILGYLGTTLYGLWVTIASVISWMNSGDLGIGNGLRNELAAAYAKNDKERQYKLIDAAFSSMIKVACFLLVLILVISEFLFRTNILDHNVRAAMYITAIFFCVNLILGVSQSVALGYQKSWMSSLIILLIQVFLIAGVLVLDALKVSANLEIYAVINGISTTFPNVLLIIYLQKCGIKFNVVKGFQSEKEIVCAITRVGLSFFGIQICSVILYSTDNVIINRILNSEMVSKYEVITKVYNAGNSVFSILLIALWSAVTYHLAQGDTKWIVNKIKQLLVVWFGFCAGVLLVSIMFNRIVTVWLGSNFFYYEPSIVLLFAIFCMASSYCAIFANVLNGMGRTKLQLVISFFETIINIPLSVILATIFGMGILGVKLATFICVLLSSIALTIETFIALKNDLK